MIYHVKSFIKIYDPNLHKITHTLDGHTDWITDITFSPHSSLFASISDDTTVRLWDTATWKTLRILEGHTHWGHSVSFNSDSSLLASAAWDGMVKIWDTTTGNLVKSLVSVTKGDRKKTGIPSHDFTLMIQLF